MISVTRVADLKSALEELRGAARRIAFVPTMGNLHAGHRKLMVEARRHADAVVASIYVNPLQFGPKEDFASYPRTPDEDRRLLEQAGVELLFMPSDAEIYPRGRDAQTLVEVPFLSDILCGAHRPTHFRGVTTVVNRLLNLVAPQVAVFGKKDYQQLLLIRLMVQDLGMPVEIVGVETEREASGLAMSSRNAYLGEIEREIAPRLYRELQVLAERIKKTGRVPPDAEDHAKKNLAAAGFRPEYVSVRRQSDLAEVSRQDLRLVILAAAWLGKARLIDNIEVEL